MQLSRLCDTIDAHCGIVSEKCSRLYAGQFDVIELIWSEMCMCACSFPPCSRLEYSFTYVIAEIIDILLELSHNLPESYQVHWFVAVKTLKFESLA